MFWTDLKLCLVFLTRLPLRLESGGLEGGGPGRTLAQAAACFPLAGAVVGLVGAAGLLLALAVGLPPLPAAAAAVTATVLLSGALHEDGLADVMDGFGGGRDKTRKLEIMRDSRIGSYGVVAIGLSLILRISLLAGILDHLDSSLEIAGILVAVHAVARGLLPSVMTALPLARTEGLAAGAERPSGSVALTALGLSLAVAVVCLGLSAAVVCMISAALAVTVIAWLAHRQIGGYTGDVLGASEQMGEIAAIAAIVAIL